MVLAVADAADMAAIAAAGELENQQSPDYGVRAGCKRWARAERECSKCDDGPGRDKDEMGGWRGGRVEGSQETKIAPMDGTGD